MCEYSFSTASAATEANIIGETSSMKTTSVTSATSIASPGASTLAAETFAFSSSTSSSSFVTYSTPPRTSSLPYTKTSTTAEKSTTSGYQDISVSDNVFLTEAPSTSSTTAKEVVPTQNDLLTSESTTISFAPNESYSRTTETEGTEVYLPTGRSIQDDDEGTSRLDGYDQTTKISYTTVSDRTDENVTHATERTTISRYISKDIAHFLFGILIS